MSKKYRKHIDINGESLTKKQCSAIKNDYEIEYQYCECCGGSYCDNYGLAIHHHIPQQFRYFGDEYVIEDENNYSVVGRSCHGILEHNESQYKRELEPINGIPYEYWHELKNGQLPEVYIEKHLSS